MTDEKIKAELEKVLKFTILGIKQSLIDYSKTDLTIKDWRLKDKHIKLLVNALLPKVKQLAVELVEIDMGKVVNIINNLWEEETLNGKIKATPFHEFKFRTARRLNKANPLKLKGKGE